MVTLTPARLRAFMRDVQKPAGEFGCWLWTGSVNTSGYPIGGGERGQRGVPVYRIAYEWMVGLVPVGMEIDHLCRTRRCVNPHHLEPVTRAENMRRARVFGPWSMRQYCRNGHDVSCERGYDYTRKSGRVDRICRDCAASRERRKRTREQHAA